MSVIKRTGPDPGPQRPRAATPQAVEQFRQLHLPLRTQAEAQMFLDRQLHDAEHVKDLPRYRQSISTLPCGVQVVINREGIVVEVEQVGAEKFRTRRTRRS